MAIEKRNRDPSLTIPSGRPVRARYFYLCDRSKPTVVASNNRIPSILKRKNRLRYTKPYPLKLITSRANIVKERSSNSSSPRSSPGKALKIVLPMQSYKMAVGMQHDEDETVRSFTPPPLYSDSSSNNVSIENKSNNVQWYSKVQVVRIPSRDQYPESMKQQIWCSLSEITENARRNTIEFSSEGWDWRIATEEKDMYIHPKTGEYIHPVHVKRAAAAAAAAAEAASKSSEDVSKEKQSLERTDAQLVNAKAA